MAATLILGINIFVAALFAVAFIVVAHNNPDARGAKCLAVSALLGIVYVSLEFVLPWKDDPAVVVSAIFIVFLLAMTAALIGVSRHYALAIPRDFVLAIWVLALTILPLNLALPYGSILRTALYQLPYLAMQALIAAMIFRSGARKALDVTLFSIASLSVLVYVAKPVIAWQLGTASSPQNYMTSQYAAISQSLGTVTLIAMALALLLIMMRDLVTEMVIRSETDPLSGLLNRRGFDVQGERMIAEAKREGESIALITVDIDHFKAINDLYGHPIGDGVIARFAEILVKTAPSGALVSRLGGEEFAVLLRDMTVIQAREKANQLRLAIEHADFIQFAQKKVTASFGTACLLDDEDLLSLLRRSDAALYRAKAEGRNIVRCASNSLDWLSHHAIQGRHQIDQAREFMRL